MSNFESLFFRLYENLLEQFQLRQLSSNFLEMQSFPGWQFFEIHELVNEFEQRSGSWIWMNVSMGHD